jgi:hypothetical protein
MQEDFFWSAPPLQGDHRKIGAWAYYLVSLGTQSLTTWYLSRSQTITSMLVYLRQKRKRPNNAAAGKAGIASLFAIEGRCTGLPEPER